MFILKALGAVMIIGASVGIGMYYTKLLKKRAEAMKTMRKNMLLLKGEIRYSQSTLNEAFIHIAEKNKGCYKNFFEHVSHKMQEFQGEPFCEIWKKQLGEDLPETKSGLNKEDIRQLVLLGDTLGFLDKEMQLNTLDLYLETVEGEIQHLFQDMPEKIRLYQIFSITGGIFLSVLML